MSSYFIAKRAKKTIDVYFILVYSASICVLGVVKESLKKLPHFRFLMNARKIVLQ